MVALCTLFYYSVLLHNTKILHNNTHTHGVFDFIVWLSNSSNVFLLVFMCNSMMLFLSVPFNQDLSQSDIISCPMLINKISTSNDTKCGITLVCWVKLFWCLFSPKNFHVYLHFTHVEFKLPPRPSFWYPYVNLTIIKKKN